MTAIGGIPSKNQILFCPAAKLRQRVVRRFGAAAGKALQPRDDTVICTVHSGTSARSLSPLRGKNNNKNNLDFRSSSVSRYVFSCEYV